MRLEELQRMLGGVVRTTREQRWLDTRIGGLRAAVIQRFTPHTQSQRFDLAVITPDARELDPLHEHADTWGLDQEASSLVMLRQATCSQAA